MNKKICVIVGAGPGMGLALGKRFAKGEYKIIFVARRLEALQQYENIMEKEGYESASFAADINNFDLLGNIFDRIEEKHGHPHVLIYNASVFRQASPTELQPEDLINDFKVNVVGALVSAKKVAPFMKFQKSGTVIFSGGGQGIEPYYGYSSLGVGKAGIRNLCFSLADELKPYGIKVGTITIMGAVKKDTHFDPDLIAEKFWDLHSQAAEDFQIEIQY
ncbi:SDR family NAD(P)-dependent oxidoreductase [soil metagenome]